jgi:hypothetical protein
MRHWLLCGVLLAAACTEQDPPAPKPDGGVKGKAYEVATPVPMHKKLPCEPVFGDSAAVSAAMGQPVEVHDATRNDTEATASCRYFVPGKPTGPTPGPLPGGKGAPAPKKAPAPPKEVKPSAKNPDALQPGEEICTVTAYCWWSVTVGDVRKKCEEGGEEVGQEFGDITCTRKVSAGESAFRYDLTILDSDSRCKVAVQAGPNVRDLQTVKDCAKSATDAISPASLKAAADWKPPLDAGAPASAPAK